MKPLLTEAACYGCPVVIEGEAVRPPLLDFKQPSGEHPMGAAMILSYSCGSFGVDTDVPSLETIYTSAVRNAPMFTPS